MADAITHQLDRLNVLTAIALRLDGAQSAMLAELRTTHNQIARLCETGSVNWRIPPHNPLTAPATERAIWT